MSPYNSSLTRVQPVFNELLDRWSDGEHWLNELVEIAAQTRDRHSWRPSIEIGKLLPAEAPTDVFERTVAPPAGCLRGLLSHPEAMRVRDSTTFGAKSQSAQEWRRKLFSSSPRDVNAAQREGLRQLDKRLAQRGRNKWWAFEGFSHIDCTLITENFVLFVEGKRTESVSPSTLWFEQRSQTVAERRGGAGVC
jgi:hypothetical protein